MRRLSNPFNMTPTSESLLKFTVQNTDFMPNSSIKAKKTSRVSNYLDMDLVQIAKPIHRYTPQIDPSDAKK